MVVLGGSHQLPRPGAVVLDVGQGDSILVVASNGSTLLVDGGPDAALLERKLSDYGVTKVDLLVLTHVHADHATGLEAVVGRRPVGEFWFPTPPHSTPASEHIAELAGRAGLPLKAAPVGTTRRLGDMSVEVLGPVREYASPNDQSVVLLVHRDGGPRLLLTGDAEKFAQADLRGVRAEVLKVPHQGAATSDLDWLASVGAKLAVIPVGPNDYGHPSLEVIATLEAHGTRVFRTDRDGDVVISLR
jgi:competence protein ComEC